MLPKIERLKDRRLFNTVFKKKRKLHTQLLTLYYLNLRTDINKLPKTAFVAGLKIHKSSVKRNQVKRRMKATYKNLKKKKLGIFAKSQMNYVLIWIANPPIIKATFLQIENSMEYLLKKLEKVS